MIFHADNKKLATRFMWMTVIGGGLIYLLAAYRLDSKSIDVTFLVLGVLTILFSSRITIEIPQFRSKISVSDTFIFLTLLLYGWKAAVLLAATEALFSSFQF